MRAGCCCAEHAACYEHAPPRSVKHRCTLIDRKLVSVAPFAQQRDGQHCCSRRTAAALIMHQSTASMLAPHCRVCAQAASVNSCCVGNSIYSCAAATTTAATASWLQCALCHEHKGQHSTNLLCKADTASTLSMLLRASASDVLACDAHNAAASLSANVLYKCIIASSIQEAAAEMRRL
eukprot:20747-Heterococcus_DN1.PRE.4